jgi:hypothetical protein
VGTEKQEGGSSHRTAKVILAIIFSAVLIPSPVQSYLLVHPTTPNSSGELQLVPATAYQQVSNPYGGTGNPPVTAASHTLDLLYQYVTSLQLTFDPQVTLQSDSITSGENITFSVKAPANLLQSQSSSVYLYLFVVDPEGGIAATSPNGATVSWSSSTSQPYSLIGNGYATINQAFFQSGLKASWHVLSNGLSRGTWKIFIVLTGLNTVANPQSPPPLWGISIASVEVGSQNVNLLPIGFGFIGALLTVYQIEGAILSSYAKSRITPRKWARDNAAWFVGVALILIYLYLVYF